MNNIYGNLDNIGEQRQRIAKPHDLSPRSKWLRDYYFKGNERE